MAVSVPGSKEQVTPFTATWPPKRMVRLWVASMGKQLVAAMAQTNKESIRVKKASSAYLSSASSY
ncbi:hypothetical protein D3C71_2165080 [compost metagenome]